MNINLRKSHAIQSEIRLLLTGVFASLTVEIDKFVNAEEKVESELAKQKGILARRINLIKALYAIRLSTQSASESSGVNRLLNEIQMLKMLSASYEVFSSGQIEKVSKEALLSMQEDLKQPSTNQYREKEKFFLTGIVSEEFAAEMKSLQIGIRKKIRNKEDGLLSWNIKTEITLDEDTEATLLAENLI